MIFGYGCKLYAQKGIVGNTDLMLTKYPSDTTEVIKLLHKGDTIEIIWNLSNSVKIVSKNDIGFVNKEIFYNNFHKITDSIENSSVSARDLDSISFVKKDTSFDTSLSRLDSVLALETKKNSALNVFSDSLMTANKVAIENNNSKMVKDEVIIISKSEDEPIGFKGGFKKLLLKSFWPVLIIVILLNTKKGFKDRRYSSGHRPSTTNGLLVVFLTGIICSLIGLCGGIYYWTLLFFK
jgi:hypothetical protein